VRRSIRVVRDIHPPYGGVYGSYRYTPLRGVYLRDVEISLEMGIPDGVTTPLYRSFSSNYHPDSGVKMDLIFDPKIRVFYTLIL